VIEDWMISDKCIKFKVLNFKQITSIAMLTENKVTKFFVMADEFCKVFKDIASFLDITPIHLNRPKKLIANSLKILYPQNIC